MALVRMPWSVPLEIRWPPRTFAVLCGPPLCQQAAPLCLLQYREQGAKFQVKTEDGSDLLRLLRIDEDPTALRIDVVAQDRMAADPLALPARGRHLVAGALGDDLPLELGEGQTGCSASAGPSTSSC